jgi:predicted metal-dependent hydrolase
MYIIYLVFLVLIILIMFLVYKKLKSKLKIKSYLSKISNIYRQNKIKIINNSTKSFTQNKKDIYLCNSDDKNIENYVLLHELSHIINKDHGHTESFKKTFSQVLDEAEKQKIVDRTKINKDKINNYCSICSCKMV